MPIPRHLQHYYKTPEFREARRRAVERSGDRCEFCGKPNRTKVETVYDGLGSMWWRLFAGRWRSKDGHYQDYWPAGRLRIVKVICTLAHLDHDRENNSDENTRLLCQWCHLNWDKWNHHVTRSNRKDGQRPILEAIRKLRAAG